MFQTIAFLAGLQLLSGTAVAQTRVFSATSAVVLDVRSTGEAGGNPQARNTAAGESSGATPAVELVRQNLIPVGVFQRTCDCKIVKSVVVDDIRDISDEFCADGNTKSAVGLSNMVWGFGQFVDHDLALTIEDEDGEAIEVDTEEDVMELHRAVTTRRRGCRNNLNVHTALLDAGTVYGSNKEYLHTMLREPGTCRLRVADGNFLPVTTNADDMGRFFFIAGDVRVSEHAFLAAQHTLWVREHNRLCGEVEADPRSRRMSADAQFDLVRNVVIAKFQQVVLTEFLPALGISQEDVEGATAMARGPETSVEFSIAFRLGHDFIPNDVGGLDITAAFNAENFFLDKTGTPAKPSVTYKADAESNLASIMTALATASANQVDGKLSNALRNFLFGVTEGQDLAGRNIFRARELGLPTYAGLAECFGMEADATVEAETPDPWVGLLREPKAADEPLPPTLRAIITEQFHRSLFGRGGHYWRTYIRKVGHFVDEIEASTYAQIISANTDAVVSGNVFKV